MQTPIHSSAKSSFTALDYAGDYYVCDDDHICRVVSNSWIAEQTSRLAMHYSQSVLEAKAYFIISE